MYPLDSIYGPKAYRAFAVSGGFPDGLKGTRQSSREAWQDEPIVVTRYAQLIEVVSFLAVMNKRLSLYFRGQGRHSDPVPAIFRPGWRSLSSTHHTIPDSPDVLNRLWERLGGSISSLVLEACSAFPMPRPATLRMFRESVWAVAQHYELWPTPLIDVTPNLRIAASFALLDGRKEGNLYVLGLPASTNSVTYDADQHVVLARLQAVCPPVAKRPHYQDGFLVGRFPFDGPSPNMIDRRPSHVSSLSRRMLARIVLRNEDGDTSFWNDDFPAMSKHSLMPSAEADPLLERFRRHADRIDAEMHEIVTFA